MGGGGGGGGGGDHGGGTCIDTFGSIHSLSFSYSKTAAHTKL